MTDHLYRSIFRNVYLSKQIFTHVSVIQQDDNSLKYDDIIEVEWMNKYGHIGLLSDKLHRGAELFHEKSRDFSVFKALVEKDFEGFKIFYQRFYKYNTFTQEDSYSSFMQVISTGNLEAVKWMIENDYVHQVSWHSLYKYSETENPEILRYLVVNGWFKVDFDLFWGNNLRRFSNKPAFLQVMIDLAPKPIPHKHVQDIVNSLLESSPNQSVLDILSPLIPDGFKIETKRDKFNVRDQSVIPAYQYIIARNLVDPHTQSLIQANIDRMDILSRKINEFFGQLETLKSYDGQEYRVQLNQLIKRQFPQGFPSDLLESYNDTAYTYDSICCQIYRLPTDVVHALLDQGFEFTRDWF
ncbi:hypothetical protein CYY_010282, partial [Polysphondylium violaceum]